MKKLRLQSHELSNDCKCTRLKCFETVSVEERQAIITMFNSLDSINAQNSYLAGLIAVLPVLRRRSRRPDGKEHYDASYRYKVRVKRRNGIEEVDICSKAFISMHGITRAKLVHIQKSLKTFGVAPVDKRGQHSSKHRKLSDDLSGKIFDHISSFRGRLSHYSLKDSKKLYLSEELNIRKMFQLFKEKHPNLSVSYDTYRNIFNTKFNISFGYPRTDTCSTCDEFTATLKSLDPVNDALQIEALSTENKLHKIRAQVFYDKKRASRKKARTTTDFEAIAMDYQKNISLPNISTNDLYYKRQLSIFSFIIHVLSSGKSVFFTYPEFVARKGSDEVASFLTFFIWNVLHLHIFCDSAGVQNKNFTIVRLLHYIVHEIKRLDSIHITFPIRGHSYLECDKNMGLINIKTRMELHADWKTVLQHARKKPEPFHVVDVSQEITKSWTSFLKGKFVSKYPFPLQKVRELQVMSDKRGLVFNRTTYNGHWLSKQITVKPKKQSSFSQSGLKEGEFELPNPAYDGLLPISQAKYDNLQVLKRFCPSAVQQIYENLSH